jgi:hypothetical protein
MLHDGSSTAALDATPVERSCEILALSVERAMREIHDAKAEREADRVRAARVQLAALSTAKRLRRRLAPSA